MSELPLGWTSATVADLIAQDGIFSDGDWVESKDQDPAGAIRLLQLADIGDGVFVDKSNRFINNEKFVQLRCTEVLEGDVLIARMPDPLGRACLAPRLNQRCITVVDVAIVRPGASSVRSKWLMHFLNAPPVRQLIEQQSSGTTRRRISRSNLAQLELPVPSLTEQNRIADKLDALLARVDACRKRLDRVPAILKRFREAVLASATSGDLTREWREERGLPAAHYDVCVLRDLVREPLRNGKSVKDGDGPMVLRLSSLRNGAIDWTEAKSGEWGDIDVHRFLIEDGDFLVARGNGSRDLVGRGGLVIGAPPKMAFPDTMIRIRPNTSRILPRFLKLIWDTAEVRRQIEFSARTTAGIWKVAQPDLEKLSIPVPELAEQQEIVRRADELIGYAERLAARCDGARAATGRLTAAALAKAFRGELVPQDPNDEPASALLARIRSRRGAPGEATKPKRGGATQGLRTITKAETTMITRKDVTSTHLTAILKERGELTAEALWNASQLEIDDFYDQLKDEEARGLLREKRGDTTNASRLLEPAA